MSGQSISTALFCAIIFASTLGGCVATHQHAAATPELRRGVQSPRPSVIAEGREYWTRGFDAAFAVAYRNLHMPGSFHRTRHARAAPAIHGVHLWDSAFLSHIWRAWDVWTAQEVALAVLNQAQNGRLPHFSHRFRRSELTQPPVISWTVWENHLWSSDTAYLASVFPVLQAYNAWLYEHRQLPSGLFFWRSPLESGMDNSPRFDSQREKGIRDMRALAAIDLSSYMVLENAMLARIAEVVGDTTARSVYQGRADQLRDLINTRLWDEETGYYYDRDEGTGELVKIRTAASFLPLIAGVPDTTRARRLRDHLLNPAAFNSLIPLPTVALDEQSFSDDMWRGPVWINVSYMIIRGLDSYGFGEAAAELAYRTIDGVFRTHHGTAGIWEFYDAGRYDVAKLQRKRGELWKRVTLGNKPLPHYGWSALVNTLLIEYLVGYRREGEERWITPRLPSQARGMRLRLTLPAEGLQVHLEPLGDGSTRGEVVVGSDRQAFVLPFGEELRLRTDVAMR